MKRSFLLPTFALLAFAGAASAATLLSVDFNYSSNVSTQSGFQSFAGPVDTGGNTASQTFGAYTVTLTTAGANASNLGFYNRNTLSNSGAFTYAALYNDFAFTNDAVAEFASIKLSISGVTAGAQYSVTLYSYDSSGEEASTTMNFNPTLNTTGTSGSVTYSSAAIPTSNGQYSTTLLVSSTTTTLDILETSNVVGRHLRFNGFELSAVPEPTSIALLGLGGGSILALRRRRKS